MYGAILHYDQCSFGPPRQSDMVLGLEMTSLYLSCGLCNSIRPQSTRKRVVNKKCTFYGKRKFNVIYGAILHYDQRSCGPPQQFDIVLGLEITSLYLSCGLFHSIRPQSSDDLMKFGNGGMQWPIGLPKVRGRGIRA
eukprot:scaffold241577_cov30-Attheya_sp.AAC.1